MKSIFLYFSILIQILLFTYFNDYFQSNFIHVNLVFMVEIKFLSLSQCSQFNCYMQDEELYRYFSCSPLQGPSPFYLVYLNVKCNHHLATQHQQLFDLGLIAYNKLQSFLRHRDELSMRLTQPPLRFEPGTAWPGRKMSIALDPLAAWPPNLKKTWK